MTAARAMAAYREDRTLLGIFSANLETLPGASGARAPWSGWREPSLCPGQTVHSRAER